MKMVRRFLFILLMLTVLSSCEKDEVGVYFIEGYITNAFSGQPIEGVTVRVDATKSSSGMGIITDGRRETVGKATTEADGHYRIMLTMFREAQRLEVYLNENHVKEGYTDGRIDASVSVLTNPGTIFNHQLSPTAILKIKFVNTTPQTVSDKFILNWCNCGQGLTKGILNKESCGAVQESEGGQWIGKDVCGIYTIEAVAGKESEFSWYVTKNDETKLYLDSVFVERGVINEFLINY